MSLTNSKKNIVFVSISSDLYGSSKILLTLVIKLQQKPDYHPIVCIPFEDGPLKMKLREHRIEVIEMPVMKLTRSMLKSFNFISLFKEYRKAKTIFERQLKDRNIFAIQSNTLATLFGSFYCFNRKINHLIHVHEIVDRPKIMRYFFSMILGLFADKIIYNSKATAHFYNSTFFRLKRKSKLLYNGVDRNLPRLNSDIIHQERVKIFGDQEELFIVGLLGRINRLKGHKTTIKAISKLKNSYPKLRVLFVGGPPEGQEHFLEDVLKLIQEENLTNHIKILPFQANIYQIIDLLDMMIVPSTEPESFGIVAVEGMLSKKAVIASNIGGLADVIENGESGLLIEPGNSDELARCIEKLMLNKKLRESIQIKGYDRALSKFSSEKMLLEFEKLYSHLQTV